MKRYLLLVLLSTIPWSLNAVAATKLCQAFHTHSKEGQVSIIFALVYDAPDWWDCKSDPEVQHQTEAPFVRVGCSNNSCTYSAPTRISQQEDCEVTVRDQGNYGEHIL